MDGVNQMRAKMDDLGGMLDSVAKSLIGQREVVSEIGAMVKEQIKVSKHSKDLETSVKVMQNEAATYAEMVKKLTNKLEKESHAVPTVQSKEKELRYAVTDCLEQDKRRRNIVVFNVPEQDSKLSRDEQLEGDRHRFEELMKAGLKLKIRPEKVTRVGKPQEDRPRLMVVTLHDETEKWEILKMAKALRHAGDRFEKVYIAPDLSPAEQERNRNLRKKLLERKEAGEDVIIHRNQVILRADRPQGRQPGATSY